MSLLQRALAPSDDILRACCRELLRCPKQLPSHPLNRHILLCRSEKTRKLRELHEELTTLDTDIQQVAAQAGAPALLEGPPAAPERPSEAELLRRRIAETNEHLAAAARGHAVPGYPGPCHVTSLILHSSHLCRAWRFEEKCSAQ